MMIELFLAAIATLIWLRVDAGLISQQAMNVMLAASINTILFNANPLMRFDGYHILADWLETPNLAKYGNQYVLGVTRKVLFGVPSARIPWSGMRSRFIKVYGFAALIWKLLICVTLVIGASNLLPGIGFLVALIAVALWLALPAFRFAKYLIGKDQADQPDRIRFAALVCGGSLVAWACGTILPSPSVVTAPIVIDYQPKRIVRAEATGFVTTVMVHPGEQVESGKLLIELYNPELELRRVELESQMLQTKMRAANRQRQHQIAAWQLEQETLESLRTRKRELENETAKLSIMAPIRGQVIAKRLQQLIGTYVRPGDELLSIGDHESMEAVALVSQQYGRQIQRSAGKKVELRLSGDGALSEGTIGEISPRLQTSPPHFAFAGVYGGPLTVVDRQQYEEDASEGESTLSLLEPMLAVSIQIDPVISSMLHAGQTGLAHLRIRDESLGRYLVQQGKTWVIDQIQFNHGL
jgi:putative peptide zinc metalloprotease protein